MPYRTYRPGVVFVTTPSGHTDAYKVGDNLSQLKAEIYSKTGIPPHMQRLFHKNRAILHDEALSSVPSESNINLLLRVMGGGNFCDICYDNAVYTCPDCSNKMFCTDRCTKIHQHPNRQEHNHTLLTSSRENNTELT